VASSIFSRNFREYVWNLRPELPSRLIESLLLEIPIPPIYFGKVNQGRLEMIDGQQRLAVGAPDTQWRTVSRIARRGPDGGQTKGGRKEGKEGGYPLKYVAGKTSDEDHRLALPPCKEVAHLSRNSLCMFVFSVQVRAPKG
jgi:Protein of unknown function DUF262